jgi:hypothetical protein
VLVIGIFSYVFVLGRIEPIPDLGPAGHLSVGVSPTTRISVGHR